MKTDSNNIKDYPDCALLFPSRYLKSAEIKAAGRPIPLTIARIEPRHELRSKDGGQESKPVMFFRETTKGFVLNKTNGGTGGLLAECLGNDPRAWIGKRVVFCVEQVKVGRKTVDGLRVDVTQTQLANSVKQLPAQPQAEQFEPQDDERALAEAAFLAEQEV